MSMADDAAPNPPPPGTADAAGPGGTPTAAIVAIWRRWRWVPAYWRFNLAQLLEYRGSFISQTVAMFINDVLWVSFWALFFERFPVVKGWGLHDVLTLWAVFAFAFGLTATLAGNAFDLARLVVTGQLDYFLALPKPVLLHVLVSKMRPTAWGDVLFGPLVFYLLVPWTWPQALLFPLVGFLAAVVFTSFSVIAGALTFYLGNGEQVGGRLNEAILHFASYPMDIFDRWLRVVLYTVIPAGFVSAVPVEVVRRSSWGSLALLAAVATGAALLAHGVFARGLRRYESGNLMQMRL